MNEEQMEARIAELESKNERLRNGALLYLSMARDFADCAVVGVEKPPEPGLTRDLGLNLLKVSRDALAMLLEDLEGDGAKVQKYFQLNAEDFLP